MSTRANIAIFLKEEDRFKPLNFNDIRFDDVRPKLHANNLQLNFSDVYCNENETTDNYVLEIYNHHDGYPDHLFSVLKRYYNSYEQEIKTFEKTFIAGTIPEIKLKKDFLLQIIMVCDILFSSRIKESPYENFF